MTLTAGVHADLFDKAACGKPGHELGSMILGRDDIPGRRRVPAGDNHPYARFIYPKFSSLEKSDPLKSAEIGGLL